MSDELLDIVDDDDLVTSQEMSALVRQSGLQHRGVHIFLVTPDGTFLVQLRDKHQGTYLLV
jgi:hypothetical protein